MIGHKNTKTFHTSKILTFNDRIKAIEGKNFYELEELRDKTVEDLIKMHRIIKDHFSYLITKKRNAMPL